MPRLDGVGIVDQKQEHITGVISKVIRVNETSG